MSALAILHHPVKSSQVVPAGPRDEPMVCRTCRTKDGDQAVWPCQTALAFGLSA